MTRDIQTSNPAPVPSEADQTQEWLSSLMNRASEASLIGLNSGFDQLNSVINGLQPGLFVVAGPPSSGKTSFLKQLADQVAEHNRVNVLYLTYDISAKELRLCSLARLGRAKKKEILNCNPEATMESYPGGPQVKVAERLETAAGLYREFGSRIQILEADHACTAEKILMLGEEAKQHAGLNKLVLVVEPLNALAAVLDQTIPDPVDRMAALCYQLRRIARDLECPVIVAVNQNRASFEDNKKPTLEAFKEVWGLEFIADVVAVLWTNKDVTRGYIRPVALYVLKNRFGDLARITMLFQPEIATFSEQGKETMLYLDGLMNQASL